MIEFDRFCYLQNQKTGCTYVETFIRQCTTDDIVRYEKHAPLTRYQAHKFYFINVRNPLDTYLSLFNYGLDGKGEIYLKLKQAGFGELYANGIAGFEHWLDFILTPEKSLNMEAASSQKDPALTHPQLGLLSYRFMRLACLGFDQAAASLLEQAQVVAYFSQHFKMNAVIKNEEMASALIDLVTGPLKPAFSSQAKTLAWLAKPQRINASVRRDKADVAKTDDVKTDDVKTKSANAQNTNSASSQSKQAISPALQQKLAAREWLIYQKYYPVA
jgi:hypothetical protein